jgi:hypothetical protein
MVILKIASKYPDNENTDSGSFGIAAYLTY